VGTLTAPMSVDVSGAGPYALGYSARGIGVDAMRALRLRPAARVDPVETLRLE
jgi:hypothetical protein